MAESKDENMREKERAEDAQDRNIAVPFANACNSYKEILWTT